MSNSARGDLFDRAWDVVWHLRVYDAYGSEQRAVAALRRSRPGYTPLQYERAFRRADALYTAAAEVARRHSRALWAAYGRPDDRFRVPAAVVAALKARRPGYRVAEYRGALCAVFIHLHVREPEGPCPTPT